MIPLWIAIIVVFIVPIPVWLMAHFYGEVKGFHHGYMVGKVEGHGDAMTEMHDIINGFIDE